VSAHARVCEDVYVCAAECRDQVIKCAWTWVQAENKKLAAFLQVCVVRVCVCRRRICVSMVSM